LIFAKHNTHSASRQAPSPLVLGETGAGVRA
jgi:hypothetical protein